MIVNPRHIPCNILQYSKDVYGFDSRIVPQQDAAMSSDSQPDTDNLSKSEHTTPAVPENAEQAQNSMNILERSSKCVPILPRPETKKPGKSSMLAPGQCSVPLVHRRRCRVRLCVIQNCNLRSHQQFLPLGPLKTRSKRDKSHPPKPDAPSWKANERDHNSPGDIQLNLIEGGVDGFPVLPLGSLEDPALRHLFHTFFSYTYDRIDRILVPPPFTKAEREAAAIRKDTAVSGALTTPVFCLQYITAAHHEAAFRRDYLEPNSTTTLLHGKLMQLLRSKLSNFVREEATELIMVIFTLVIFEISTGRAKALESHREAFHHLVKSHGLFKARNGLALILTLDRVFAIFTCLPPLYSPPPNNLIRKARDIPPSYGSFFENESSKSVVEADVHQYCLDACHLIEILEREGWSFNPYDPPLTKSTNLHYFFFLRDCLVNDFVKLHLAMAEQATLSRCILLAAKIVDYTVLMDNYLIPMPIELANKVKETLIKIRNVDSGRIETRILRWILFVLASMSAPWTERQWALQLLRDQLKVEYSTTDWPANWRNQELENVRRFVWSDSRFNEKFVKTCSDIQHAPTKSGVDMGSAKND